MICDGLRCFQKPKIAGKCSILSQCVARPIPAMFCDGLRCLLKLKIAGKTLISSQRVAGPILTAAL